MTGMADAQSLPELEAYYLARGIPLPPPLEPEEVVRVLDVISRPPFEYRAEYRAPAHAVNYPPNTDPHAYAPRAKIPRTAKKIADMKIREIAVEERPDIYPYDHFEYRQWSK